ncbi:MULTISPECIES: YojF family protein [Pontibacillus]|uniref:YojF family protein n=1 Tax=Pontibacillus chungwhensis TaxID=265426 RepID=A0ABY8UVY2_9BACI|nr:MULTISPECIES: YojF family protein [Pontibacillus]MCD5325867.1 YojF family protein [Pontibacillus sp. HN14]WIF97578.1 YojF family protein [Pontibacillus chungwhensis]
METIQIDHVQKALENLAHKDVYIHLETTNGAYARHFDSNAYNVGAFIRNAQVRYTQAKIIGHESFRVGLKTQLGWIYAEGLTDWELDDQGRLLMAGHDNEGRLMVALEISEKPFN